MAYNFFDKKSAGSNFSGCCIKEKNVKLPG